MEKYYQKWHTRKTALNNNQKRPFFHEREIWWCSMGTNIGYEQDGKGEFFSRPILIIKKFNHQIFWGVPITTKNKQGKYYHRINLGDSIIRNLIISQIRLFDAKRLNKKIFTLNLKEFFEIKKAIIHLLR